MFYAKKFVVRRVRLISEIKPLCADLTPPPILISIAGGASTCPLSMLTFNPFGHIIYSNQSLILDTLFV